MSLLFRLTFKLLGGRILLISSLDFKSVIEISSSDYLFQTDIIQSSRVYSLPITHVTLQTIPRSPRGVRSRKDYCKYKRVVLMIQNVVHGKKLTLSPHNAVSIRRVMFTVYTFWTLAAQKTKHVCVLKVACRHKLVISTLPHLTVARSP